MQPNQERNHKHMRYKLGEDPKHHDINWDTDVSTLLTITGRPASGKSTLLARIMREAVEQGGAVAHIGITPDLLPSPAIETCAYSDPGGIIGQLERIQAEQERRTTAAHSHDATVRQGDGAQTHPGILLACDDLTTLNTNPIEDHERPEGDYATILHLLTRIIQRSADTNTAVVITGQLLNRRTIGLPFTHILKSGVHTHLGPGNVTGLIGSDNHKTAAHLIEEQQHDTTRRYGWGVVEHPLTAVRTLHCPDPRKDV